MQCHWMQCSVLQSKMQKNKKIKSRNKTCNFSQFKTCVIAIQKNKKKVDHWIFKSSSQFQPTTLQNVPNVLTPTRWLWRLSQLTPPGRSSPAALGAETQEGSYRQLGCKGWSRGWAAGDEPVYSTLLKPTPAKEPITGTPQPAEPHRTRRWASLSNKPRYHGAEPE